MKRLILFAIIIFMAAPALAVPSITNLQLRYPEVWLGEGDNIYLTCTDSVQIDKVYADIIGPGVILPRLYFSNVSGSYNVTIDSSYLDRIGQFNATIVCNNTNSESVSTAAQITVSQLTGYIYNTTPSVYTGNIIEIDIVVMKNNQNLSSDVLFDVNFNNQPVTLRAPPAYDMNKGWLLKLNADEPGDYDVDVHAYHDRTSITKSTFVSVKDEIQFEILNLDKANVKSKENLTIGIRSSEKGTPINLNNNNLEVTIDYVSTEILNITKNGDIYNVRVAVPELSYGTYDLYAVLDYKGTHESNTTIDYPLEIKGKLVPGAQLKFIIDDKEKIISTDSNGDYSGYLLPDTYTLEVSFPKSRLYLYTISIQNYTDAIKYSSPTGIEIPGVRAVDVHAYDVQLPFHSAAIDIFYDDSDIAYEDEITLLKCYEWSFVENECDSDWVIAQASINKSTNTIKMDVYNFSAFAISTVKRMVLDFSFDKEKYSLSDIVSVNGRVYDEDMNTISDVKVKLEVEDTDIASTTFSDEHGKFSIDFIAPDLENVYTVLLSAEKYGFVGSNSTDYIEVGKSTEISIIFPDTIKISPGETIEKELKIINIGQTSLYNLRINMTGTDYYFVTPIIEELSVGEEKTLNVKFFVPLNVSKGTQSVVLSVSNDEVRKEEIFGFTIEEIGLTTTTTPTGWAINIGLGQITSYLNSILFIIIFATVAFTTAYVMKKKRRKGNSDVDQLVFSMKNGHQNTINKLKSEITKLNNNLKEEPREKEQKPDSLPEQAKPESMKEMPKQNSLPKEQEKGEKKDDHDKVVFSS